MYDFRVNARVLCFEKTEFIIPIDNIDLSSITNWSTMAMPEVAIMELPDTLQKKKPKNMTKKELELQVTYYRAKKKELLESVGSIRKELEVMKAQIEELKRERVAFDSKKNVNRRTVDLEKKVAELEQYSRREYVELIGLPEDTQGEEHENPVVQPFEIAGVDVAKRHFHAI